MNPIVLFMHLFEQTITAQVMSSLTLVKTNPNPLLPHRLPSQNAVSLGLRPWVNLHQIVHNKGVAGIVLTFGVIETGLMTLHYSVIHQEDSFMTSPLRHSFLLHQ